MKPHKKPGRAAKASRKERTDARDTANEVKFREFRIKCLNRKLELMKEWGLSDLHSEVIAVKDALKTFGVG